MQTNNQYVITMDKEVWKDVQGYEGIYEISNFGRVKSVARTKKCGDMTLHYKERIKSINKNAYGYPCVTLCKNGKSTARPIHILVATAFIDNPENKPHVDHINTDKSDYRIENLRWCTVKENANNVLTRKHCRENTYSKENLEKRIITRKNGSTKTRPITVYQYTKNGELVMEYESSRHASRVTGIHSTLIRKVAKNEYGFAGGFFWSYKKDVNSIPKIRQHTNSKAVLQYSKDGTLINEFKSLKEACAVYGSTTSNLSKMINRGCPRSEYIWKFK